MEKICVLHLSFFLYDGITCLGLALRPLLIEVFAVAKTGAEEDEERWGVDDGGDRFLGESKL